MSFMETVSSVSMNKDVESFNSNEPSTSNKHEENSELQILFVNYAVNLWALVRAQI